MLDRPVPDIRLQIALAEIHKYRERMPRLGV
jgi:hypothetical protein